MTRRCRSIWSFFVRPSCDPDDLAAQSFFVRFHGRGGLTKSDVDAMSVTELNAEARRLRDTLNDEAKAHTEAVERSKQKRHRR